MIPIASPNWLTPLLQAAGTLVGAGIGAAATWFTAVRRLRHERAFDRQLEWHERMHRALAAAHQCTSDALALFSGDATRNPAALLTKIAEGMQGVRAARTDALLFASSDVVISLNRLFAEAEKEFEGLRDQLPAIAAMPNGMAMLAIKNVSTAEALLNMLVHSMRQVGASHRSHLKLEPLPDEAFPDSRSLIPDLKAKLIRETEEG